MNTHCGFPIIYLGNNICQFVQEVKYLGFIIHSTIDVARQTRKFYFQAYLTPSVTKGTLRKKNKNLCFGVLCLITFHWSF